MTSSRFRWLFASTTSKLNNSAILSPENGREESDSRNGHHVKPIIITINTDDQRARVDRVEEINRQRVLSDPYARQRAQRQDENQIQPKQEFLSQQEAEEYDDIPEEPKSSLPDVPKLPKAADYSDSGESDEDLRIQEIGDRRAYEDEERRGQVKGKQRILFAIQTWG
uniref:Uncharacterized protein n=1 Tax=Caenorhabditis japonica TaxID=281687 RepID=A0A8R1IBE7_CAEJA